MYIAEPRESLKRVELDGLTLLFHRPSGMTHIVAAPAPEVLEALWAGAGDVDAVLAWMAERYELGEGGAEAVAARLAELETAGLVRRR